MDKGIIGYQFEAGNIANIRVWAHYIIVDGKMEAIVGNLFKAFFLGKIDLAKAIAESRSRADPELRTVPIGWALQLRAEDSTETWSDAPYADNTIDRKTSQAYVMKLFRGVIGWRANKQDTLTTSTTKAELLSHAQATKEAARRRRYRDAADEAPSRRYPQ